MYMLLPSWHKDEFEPSFGNEPSLKGDRPLLSPGITGYALTYFNLRNSSIVSLMSLTIWRNNIGEMSLPLWNGTVVRRPSG